jgi:hypothetical protein
MTGDIDQGYLVTNTDFTSDARGSLQNQPQEKYLFLVTYEELLQSLIDAHNYLRDFATHFENNRYLDRYIDLSVIDTTGIPGTAFDLIPGDRITMMSQEKEVHFSRQVQAIVIEKERLDGLITKGIATRNKISNQLLLNEYRLREFIRRSEQNRYMESHKHRKAYQEMFIRAIRNVFRVV